MMLFNLARARRVLGSSVTKLGVRRVSHVSNDSVTDLLLAKSLSNKNDEFIRCTIFDSHGDVVVQGKDIKKLQLLKSNNLVPRDLRKISKNYTPNSANYINLEVVPSIVTRSNCILLNLLNIRALIKSDQIVLFEDPHKFDGSGLNELFSHGNLLTDMNNALTKPGDIHLLPYEFRALEVILNHTVTELTTELKIHSTSVKNLLDGLEDSIDSHRLRYLLIQSKKMTQFHRKATLVRDSLDEVMEDDDVLNSLYLKDVRYDTNHQEVELLLESYYVTLDEVVQKMQNLISQTRSTNEIVNIILDANRNEMMLLGLKFGLGLLLMGMALYVAAVYGMNLENFIEETDFGFPLVINLSFLILVIYLVYSLKRLRKVMKITMTGKKDQL